MIVSPFNTIPSPGAPSPDGLKLHTLSQVARAAKSCRRGVVGSINYFAYDFIKIHRTLRVTPAMAAGVTGRLFDVMDLVNLLIGAESEKAA